MISGLIRNPVLHRSNFLLGGQGNSFKVQSSNTYYFLTDYFLEEAIPIIKPMIAKAGASLIYKACWGQSKPKSYAGTDLVSMIEQIIQGTCQGIYLKKKL